MMKFIDRLDDTQLKVLIVLGLAECDRTNDFEAPYLNYAIRSLDDIELVTKKQKNSLYVSALYSKNESVIANFTINDFSMTISDGGWHKDLSKVLRAYLTNQFADEYALYLYRKRISEAGEELRTAISDSAELFEKYYPKYLLNCGQSIGKSKVIK